MSIKSNLNDEERIVFKRIPKYLKKLGTNLWKRSDYQKNYLYGIDRLFDEDIYYKHFEVKSAFNGNYVLYESNGDEIRSLSVLEYLRISPKWLNNKKSTINPQNTDDNNCFQYSIAAALNHQKITNHSERISNPLPFINNYNWNDIKFPAGHRDYSALKKNNSEIALNILYVP